MSTSAALRGLVLGCTILALGACASSRAGGGTRENDGRSLAVQVTNDLIPPSAITVWVVGDTGSRRRLGRVQPDQRGTFSYAPANRGAEHRLLAEAADGREITSDPFSLSGVAVLSWEPGLRAVKLESSQQTR